MPLGDFWRGVCRSEDAPFAPDDSTLRDLCNMGYARQTCPRCKDASAGDAVRFLVGSDQNGLIRIDYAIERDHHPQAQGAFQFRRSSADFAGAVADTIIEKQALAYVKSYLRRKPAA